MKGIAFDTGCSRCPRGAQSGTAGLPRLREIRDGSRCNSMWKPAPSIASGAISD